MRQQSNAAGVWLRLTVAAAVAVLVAQPHDLRQLRVAHRVADLGHALLQLGLVHLCTDRPMSKAPTAQSQKRNPATGNSPGLSNMSKSDRTPAQPQPETAAQQSLYIQRV